MIALPAACVGSASGGCGYFTGKCYEPEYEQNYDNRNYFDDSLDAVPYDGFSFEYDWAREFFEFVAIQLAAVMILADKNQI